GTGGAAGTGGRGGTGGTGGAAGSGGRGGTGGAAASGGRGGTGGNGGMGGMGGGAGMWRGEVAISSIAGQQTYPSVTVDKNGNAVVVYEQASTIYSVRYDAAQQMWSLAGTVDPRGGVSSKPSIAVDKDGNYLVVWGIAGANQGIWYSTSINGTDWKPPTSITVTNAFGPALAMNATGAAVVAWTEWLASGKGQASAAVRLSSTASFSAPKVMRDGDEYSADTRTAVAIAGTGHAFVGWEQNDGAGNGWISLWLRDYTPGGSGDGWGAAGTFESYTDFNAYGISLAANTAGDAIGTYIQISSSNPRTAQIWARRYRLVNQAFDANPTKVTDTNSIDGTVSPSVTMDDNGNATLAWSAETGTGFQVQTSRTSPTDVTWPIIGMETNDTAKDDDPNSTLASVTMPQVRAEPGGNVTLVWRKRTTASAKRFDLVARRWTPATQWGMEAPLEANTTNSVFWPVLAVGPNGTAVVTWYFGTSLDVWANVFH
ncbi:MAG TPA: hypothetical protein VN903_22000, partial [Polyangia bacterium]|nr:hypothetical protein [Polyangia bacterium]